MTTKNKQREEEGFQILISSHEGGYVKVFVGKTLLAK